MARKYPCHEHPKENWCDRDGPGGFMGHTCIERHRSELRRNKNLASEDIRIAEEDTRKAMTRYHQASDALDDFDFKYGSQSDDAGVKP